MTPWLIVAQRRGGGIEPELVTLIPWLLVIIPSLATLALLIIALIHAIRNPRLTDNERIVWVIVICLVGCVGPILYLLVGRNTNRSRPARRPAPPEFGRGAEP